MYVVLSIKEEERMTQCRKQSEMSREERSDFVESFESWFHTIPACISKTNLSDNNLLCPILRNDNPKSIVHMHPWFSGGVF